MTKIRLDGVTKAYGEAIALRETSFEIEDGAFVTLLGPSGSGKTTILNIIAGIAAPSTGRVHIDGRDVTDLSSNKRELGIVFQHYALLPHMTVFENIAFPLRVRKWRRRDIEKRVDEILAMVHLPGMAKRRPGELSGGQQQRVAIARCLAYRPALILMDEPLGALDKKLREELQLELKRIHAELGVTILYVTHDQEEALTMSDRILLMRNGGIEQAGTPTEMYLRPATHFAATFLGDSNIIAGRLTCREGPLGSVETAHGLLVATIRDDRLSVGAAVVLMVRPENVLLGEAERPPGPANFLAGRMIDAISHGGTTKSFIGLEDGTVLTVRELTRAGRAAPTPGTAVGLGWAAEDSLILPPDPSP
jgi:putative spermidine/putrescine transport system ATP-binding protein